MDFSQSNIELWLPVIQIGIIAVMVLFANILRRKVKFIRKTMIPTSVLAGFLLLILRSVNVVTFISDEFLEAVTYHCIALGFIAMSLRIPEKTSQSQKMIGSKSGALIVSTYLVQAITGLGV